MSSKKIEITKDFSIRLNEIMEYLLFNKRQQGKFAKTIGVSPSYFSEVLNSKAGPSFNLLFGIAKEFSGINLNWLLTGEGKMISRLETEPEMQIAEEASIYKVENEDPEIIELLDGARKVLKSGNQVAYDALERNIRYFSHTIEIEKEVKTIKSRLEVLEKRLPQNPEGENTGKKVM